MVMDRRELIKIGLSIAEFVFLAMAVYAAYTMYQYRNGWEDAMRFYNETHFMDKTSCQLILNNSGV